MKATKGMYMNINFPWNYCGNKRQKNLIYHMNVKPQKA